MGCGVEGQYRISVTIGSFEDFLTDDKFISFTMVEDIGLSLPYWELKFDCVFPEMLKYFNEKQSITIQLGTTSKDLEPLKLRIKVPIVTPKSADSSAVTLRGFLDTVPYLENEIQKVYSNVDSKTLASTIARKYGWTFKSNIKESKDKMTYYQPGFSDFKFLFTEWLHSYYKDNDIIIPAITSNGVLSYNSLSDLIANTDLSKLPTFVDSNPEDKEIQVNANCGNSSGTAISNAFGNYMKQRDVFNIDTGVLTHIDVSNDTPIISESKTNSIENSISKSSGYFEQSSNVHENYYKQELVNTQKFVTLQSSKQWISAADTILKNVYPGDLVLYMTKKGNHQVNDQTSGMYLVGRRVISIKNRHVHTNLRLCRENMNYSK